MNGINMYLLNSADPNNQMEALLFKLDKNANSGKHMYKHFGQEFIYVLDGMLEIVLNDKKYTLEKGDTIYFNSSTPHSFGNLSKGKTEALWVVTPPTF
jgi:quercetin dioxygenase-like cupin family protein